MGFTQDGKPISFSSYSWVGWLMSDSFLFLNLSCRLRSFSIRFALFFSHLCSVLYRLWAGFLVDLPCFRAPLPPVDDAMTHLPLN